MASTNDEFRKEVHGALKVGFLGRLARYLEQVEIDGSVEDRRKGLEFEMRVLGLEAEKKQDPYANLPVFNFVFSNGSISATNITPAAIEVVEALPPPVTAAHLDTTVLELGQAQMPVAEPPSIASVSQAEMNDLLDDLDKLGL